MTALRLVSLRPGDWGWTVAGGRDTPVTRRLGVAGGPPSWLLWELDPDAGQGRTAEGFTRRLAPFLGVMGVPPAEPGEHSTIPPRAACGGNIDCPMTTEAVIGLAPGRPVGSIHAEAPSGRVTFGFDGDLNVAMGDALDAMVRWLQVLSG